MKRVLFAGLLTLVSGVASAATIITVDGNVLFTTGPTVSFDTSQNVLVIQSNENLTCSGGPAVVPGLTTLSVQIDGNDIYELQSEITIERVNGDTLVQMTTTSADTLCSFVDEIFADGFEAPVAQSPFTSS
jgi:hypothetical protein